MEFSTITREQLKEKLDEGMRMQLLDIRPRDAYRKEHIPKAFNIPHDQLEEKAQEFLNYEDPIVMYGSDEQDVFPSRAAEILVSRKYKPDRLHLLTNGFVGWRGGGYFTASE